jgi:hypothetical protein
MSFFRKRNLKNTVEHESPSGKYRLVIGSYTTKKGCWNYSMGTVYEGDRLIKKIKRNYSAFPFAWVEGHPNGHDYLICGEDYQGQTFVELDTGKKRNHVPDAAKKGAGFCWATQRPSPDGTMIAVEGCYWAAPYEVVIYDFSDPMAKHPPIEISRDHTHDAFCGWNEDNSAQIGRRFDVVEWPGHKHHGKDLEDIEIEDMDELEQLCRDAGKDEEAYFVEKEDSERWVRPDSWLGQARTFTEYVAWSGEMLDEPDPDQVEILKTLKKRLTPEEVAILEQEAPEIVSKTVQEARERKARWEAAAQARKEREAAEKAAQAKGGA